jgi:hypothetical protein
MKKLKLESLEVTSFETLPAARSSAGTVRAREEMPAPTVFHCPTDPNFDCTYGCSNTVCPDGCPRITQTIDCV